MDEDILEVGDDGVFEITSTKPVKQTVVPQPNYDDVKFEDEEDTENREDMLNNINPGEFKIFKSNGFVYILLKLQDGDAVQKVSLVDQDLLVETVSCTKSVVSLKNIDAINPKSGSCTAWKDYVTIKYALL